VVSKPKPQIAIVGLGLIGASMGMALRQAGVASSVVGHDKELAVANRARKAEAVDKVDWNLVSACEGADLVIVATPIGGIEPTFQAIGPYLRAGSVVIDTASLKLPVLAWAKASLPAQIHYVGANPILRPAPAAGAADDVVAIQGGLRAARADLFKDALFCLVPAPEADPAAVKLAADLASLLGAQPFFMEAAEHDSLMAAVDHLPMLASLGMLETAAQQPSWKELRKVAGVSFQEATRLGAADPASAASLAAANRDSVMHWIDALVATLTSIRQSLADGDEKGLAARFQNAVEARDSWLNDRATGKLLDVLPPSQMPNKSEMFDAFLGSYLRRGLTGQRRKGK
jgi:prephenate dehydrogenase